jgi:tetratricopeptide (TPR) repeat protein
LCQNPGSKRKGKESPLSEHPTEVELQAFAQGRLEKARVREILLHFLSGCGECWAALQSSMPLVFAGLPAGLEGFALYEALLERSWLLRHEDPVAMVRLAKLATLVAGRLSARRYGRRRLADFQARAWGELANAHRVADDLDEAGEAFERSFKYLARGTGDEWLQARLYDLQASYLGARRWFVLALGALDVVHAIHQRRGDQHLAGRALISKGIYTDYQGHPVQAIALFREGLSRIDEEADRDLAFTARYNLAICQLECGQLREARAILWPLLRERSLSGRINRFKALWVKGRIDLGLGELARAGQALLESKAGFEEAGMGFAAALVSLELALVWLNQNRPEQAWEVVTEAKKVFQGLRVHREVLAAVMILQRSIQLGKATTGLVESVVQFARQAQVHLDPDARFVPRF